MSIIYLYTVYILFIIIYIIKRPDTTIILYLGQQLFWAWTYYGIVHYLIEFDLIKQCHIEPDIFRKSS